MKVQYISRYKKSDDEFDCTSFTGGADNLKKYLIYGFKKYIIGGTSPINTNEFVCNEDPYSISDMDDDITHILFDSSCLPSMREFYDIIKSNIDKIRSKDIKMYIFMHSSILSCEDQRWEYNMTPTLYDLRDLGIYNKLADLGMNYLYASANVAFMSRLLVGNGTNLPINDYISPHMNKDVLSGAKKVYNNKVLYINAYYHPAAGIHVVMNAIKNSNVGEFEWYLVGNIFDDQYLDQYNASWTERYKDILDREDVHLEGPQYGEDLIRYYNMCSYNLIPSICESYSFKALEAISYGVINVTSTMNSYLPWVKHAITVEPGDSVEEFGLNLINQLRKPRPHNNVIIAGINSIKYNIYIKEFGVISRNACYEYIVDYFNRLSKSMCDALCDTKCGVLSTVFNSGHGRI